MNLRIIFFLFFLAFLFLLATDTSLTGFVVYKQPIMIMSYPVADVFIDGEYWGQTPQEVSLSRGYHNIRFSAPGHETVTKQINTKYNQKEVFVLLEQS